MRPGLHKQEKRTCTKRSLFLHKYQTLKSVAARSKKISDDVRHLWQFWQDQIGLNAQDVVAANHGTASMPAPNIESSTNINHPRLYKDDAGGIAQTISAVKGGTESGNLGPGCKILPRSGRYIYRYTWLPKPNPPPFYLYLVTFYGEESRFDLFDRSSHLRLPTRVSKWGAIVLWSWPAATIVLRILFRYASKDLCRNRVRPENTLLWLQDIL